jgi:RNA polymerase sigma factor (sigma-70 family)
VTAAQTAAARTTAAGVATASAPHDSLDPSGRPGERTVAAGAAAARTEELYTRYRRTVSGLCHALLRDRAEAEDAAQQTFLSAHRALLGGTDPREPAAWLAAIARNECWARIRGRMREPLPVSELETASARHDPLEEAIRRADLAALWRAVEELPRPQRDALLLREFGGLSYEELAAALAVSGPAVESLLFRARQRLRLRLRAAYASLGGGAWLDAIARLIGGAPVAAKVAALGVGAATVTGSAVVVPQALEGGSLGVRPAQAHVPTRHARKVRHEATPAPAPVSRADARPSTAAVRSPVREQETTRHEGGETGSRGSDGPASAPVSVPVQADRSGADPSGGEDGSTTVPTAPQLTAPQLTAPEQMATTTTDGRDGGGGSSGSDGGSSGSDGGSSGSDGGSGGSD